MVVAFLETIARALKDGGASPSIWEPLVDRALAFHGADRDLVWARLTLLRDRHETVSTGAIAASRWLAYDRQAVAIARASGDEDAYARTLEPFDWRTPEEALEVFARARIWQHPAAILRALGVGTRTALLLHGDFREALERGKEFLAAASRYGSLAGQADALIQLASARMALGEWLLAQHTTTRAKELVERLGPNHRLHVILDANIASVFAYYLGGDWAALAERTTRLAARPAAGRAGLLGLLLGALAAQCQACLGNAATARDLLAALTPVVERMEPTMHHQNSVVYTAGCAIWAIEARELAASYRQLALDLIAAGVGDTPHGSSELTVARMDALLGDLPAARSSFAHARSVLDQRGERAVRALADYDEALALRRLGLADDGRRKILLEAALAGFRALGMEVWARRTSEEAEAAPTLSRSSPQPVIPSAPDHLTRREIEVLRLIASGRTTNEIAQALVVSPGTVERHITNLYGKIGARGRADATAYALTHGLA